MSTVCESTRPRCKIIELTLKINQILSQNPAQNYICFQKFAKFIVNHVLTTKYVCEKFSNYPIMSTTNQIINHLNWHQDSQHASNIRAARCKASITNPFWAICFRCRVTAIGWLHLLCRLVIDLWLWGRHWNPLSCAKPVAKHLCGNR